MHKGIVRAGGLALLAAAALAAPAQATGAERYVVVLEQGTEPAQVAADHGRKYGAAADRVYRAALRGYAGTIPATRVDDLRRDRRVAYVEPDAPVQATAQTLPWGIDRVDADLSSTAAGDGSGAVSGTTAYVIDTGIASHSDLNLVKHVNFAKGKNTDCNGHGTHVAGTIAARDNTTHVVGVAPGVPLVGVKVLDCRGSGTISGVISGVDWVTANHGPNAVANMSLGGGASRALDDAVRASVAGGVTYAIAAGNDGADACTQSPARIGASTPGAMTIAATDSGERETSWSNFGSCVDLWAPGASILSTATGGGTTTMSGTSMASPHAAGGASLLLSRAFATPADVEAGLAANAAAVGTASKDGRPVMRLNVGPY